MMEEKLKPTNFLCMQNVFNIRLLVTISDKLYLAQSLSLERIPGYHHVNEIRDIVCSHLNITVKFYSTHCFDTISTLVREIGTGKNDERLNTKERT